MTYTLVGRSILVPSSFLRTLWISAAGAAPTIVYFTTLGEPFEVGRSAESARIFSLFGSLWCVLAVLAAAANSRQLYGLRAKIRAIGKLGQYTLEERIGEGGMGTVYRATHAMLRRPAAIKLLAKERASERDLARFEREVQLTSRLSHPNTVSIFDYGRTADGVFYYVMEYLDGLDLDRLVKEVRPPRAPASHQHPRAGLRRARGGARPRSHPSRHQAREHRTDRAHRPTRRGQGGRFRIGEDAREKRRWRLDDERDRGHADVSLARGHHGTRHGGRAR